MFADFEFHVRWSEMQLLIAPSIKRTHINHREENENERDIAHTTRYGFELVREWTCFMVLVKYFEFLSWVEM